MKIERAHIEYMLKRLELPDGLRAKLEATLDGRASLTLDDADELRDLCGDRLATYGFDREYKPTAEGVFLEELIDRLFTG